MTIDASLNVRLRRVVRKHAKMRRNGVVYRVGRDGLIRARPSLIRPQMPLQGVAIIFGLLILFKSVMFAQIGAGNYAAKIDALRSGTTFERAGAVLLQEEPVTIAVGGYLKRYFFQR